VLGAARAKPTEANWLQQNLIGVDKPGQVAFLRVRRKNNAPEQEYVLLFHAGVVGTEPDALLPLPSGDPLPRRRVPAFDIRQDRAPARLVVSAGQICVERTGSELVTVGGRPLEASQAVPLLPPCDMMVGTTTFHVEP
jgi:hypothetical protein